MDILREAIIALARANHSLSEEEIAAGRSRRITAIKLLRETYKHQLTLMEAKDAIEFVSEIQSTFESAKFVAQVNPGPY